MAVKRFRPPYVSSDENRMVTDTDGCYVLASDYYALCELARNAARALNLGLSLVYEKRAQHDRVTCTVCHRSWPTIINPDRTAGALIEHDPDRPCGIMHAALTAIQEFNQ
jgi:hypothetical protein